MEKILLHLLGQVLTALIGNVSITVGYHSSLRVAGISLDSFNVAIADLELDRCTEMPEAVKDNRRKPGFLNKGF